VRLIEQQLARDTIRRNETVHLGAQLILASMLADSGRFEAALSLQTEVIPTLGSLFGPGNHANTLAEIARCLAELGRFPEARRALEEALTLARANDLSYVTARALYEQSYACLLESEAVGGAPALLAQARDAILASLAEGQHLKFEQAIPFACNYAAEVYLALGDAEQALVRSAEGLAMADRYPFEYYLPERFWYTHARALRAAGQAAAAEAFLARAGALVLEIAGRMTDPVLRAAWLTGVRANRRLLAEWQPPVEYNAANPKPG
jgi:tetratricopeptide (TPR) repeat protein